MKSWILDANIQRYRQDPTAQAWRLPPWGHPLSAGVFPLFLELEKRLFPIGTAFTVGGAVQCALTAFHCIYEAIKLDQRIHRRYELELPLDGEMLKAAGLYVLHSYPINEATIRFALIPVENLTAGRPLDIVFMQPQFTNQHPMLRNKLSFELPSPDTRIHSIGYHSFRYPDDGISLAGINTFDWQRDYRHELQVVEGTISTIFTQKLSAGYLAAPCFIFSGEIEHGMSGGPVYDFTRGVIVGVNSASVTRYFSNPRPCSAASLIYPMLLNSFKFGIGVPGNPKLRINAVHSIIDMMDRGSIATDGTHKQLFYQETEDGLAVGTRISTTYSGMIFEDLAAYQEGRHAKAAGGPFYVRTSDHEVD